MVESSFKHLSIFDLDHTLFPYNLSVAFGKFLYKKKVLSFYALIQIFIIYVIHKCFYGSLFWLHQKVFNLFFKNLSKGKIQLYVQEFLKHALKKGYTPALNCLKVAKQENHLIALFSSSPDFIVEPVAKFLEIKEWLGTCYQVNEENFFSHLKFVVDGNYKAKILEQLREKYLIQANQTTIYSDSFLDLPLFEKAEFKVAVNPGIRLYAYSVKRGWKII